jgi:hypothetical protein
MYGMVALVYGLRRCRAEVRAAWKRAAAGGVGDPPAGKGKGKGVVGKHNPQGAVGVRTCPFDERFGFRCYCYDELTRELADRLPDGPNVMVAPARSCAAMVKDAKTKLDSKLFKIRGVHDGCDKEDKLTPADVSALRATITVTQGVDGPVYQYEAKTGQNDYILVVSPEFIVRLNGQLSVEVGVAGSASKAKKSALLPGMVLMDEFHEYAISTDRTVAWLQHLKKCCLDSQQLAPLAYFVSGTPFGDTPRDIHSAISVLETETETTLKSFSNVAATFDRLSKLQASGEPVATADIADYHRRLDGILNHTMVRRLGTDQFQGRNLTDIGPLKVNIVDHQLPFSLTYSLQSLANQTREHAIAAAKTQGISVARLLRSQKGEALLLKLRLASTFPGIAGPSAAGFTFTASEIHTHLTAAKGDVTKTPYYQHIPTWAASSPKLATITQTITTMLSDKTPIPGAASHNKKLVLFSPLEAESLLLHGYLLLLKQTKPSKRNGSSSSINTSSSSSSTNTTTSSSSSSRSSTTPTFTALKPLLLHSTLPQATRQQALTSFLTEGNAPPNVLVAPLALAGTGLNLQRARYSTVTGPAWSKRENQQAYYRIHRVGQRMETRLQLLTGRWNPAERVVLGGYEGGVVAGGEGDGEGVWEVGNGFCEVEGGGGGDGGLVERHQGVVG